MSTPSSSAGRKPPTLKKTPSSGKASGQRSILGFFPKKPAVQQSSSPVSLNTTLPIGSPKKKLVQNAQPAVGQSLTPAPSSDAVIAEDDEDINPIKPRRRGIGLPSPVTPASLDGAVEFRHDVPLSSSPPRKVL